MTIIDSGKANLHQPKQKSKSTGQKRLKEFLKDLGEDTPRKHRYASDAIWDCLEEFGYADTKADFEWIEQWLIEESENLIEELQNVLEKKANVKFKERFIRFNKKMGELPKIYWQSLPKKKTEKKESEHKAEDILSMIRKRQQN